MTKSSIVRFLLVITSSVVLGCSGSSDGNKAAGAAGSSASAGTSGGGGTSDAGVTDASGAAGSAGTTGAAGTAGGAGGGAGTGGQTLHCDPYTDNSGGCLCGGTRPGGLAECSPDSVKGTDEGFCCGDSVQCSCYRIACVSLPNIKSCDCGIPLDSSGTRVDSCPQPTGGVCCLEAGLGQPARCHCSGYDTSCGANETEVTSCALADVMDCGPDNPVVPTCK